MKLQRVIAENAVEVNNELFFPIMHGNSLYCYDKGTASTTRLGNLMPQTPKNSCFRLCEALAVTENTIVVAPSSGDAVIGLYDIRSKTYDWISVEHYVSHGNKFGDSFKFCECVAYGDFVYLFGFVFPAILRVNTKTKTVDLAKKYVGNANLFLLNGTKKDNIVYLPYAAESQILKFDLSNGLAEDIKVDGVYKGFSGAALDETAGILYLNVIDTDKIVGINLDGHIIEEYTIPVSEELRNKKPLFENITGIKTGFYIFPVCADHVFYFDYTKKEISVVNEVQDIIDRAKINKEKGTRSIFSFSARSNYAYLIDISSKEWYEVDLIERNVTFHDIRQAINGMIDYLKSGVRETENMTLNDYIGLVMEM